MNTLPNERTRTTAPRIELKDLLAQLLKAFGPTAAGERSRAEDRELRRELWMLGGG